MKEILERHIQSELDKFTEHTGFTVADLQLTRHEIMGANGRTIKGPYEIRLTVLI